eukprot:5655047-Prymnesium_polylepis.1
MLVVHELPPSATREIAAEALRVLRPGGQMWLCEMDFDTEGFAKLRASARTREECESRKRRAEPRVLRLVAMK